MSTASDAIEILQGALILADFFEKEEREQVLRRVQQLQRRAEDPRTFIAFVGEKKAGKSSLLKAITGVPLPTAVRECTAAVCLIQLGLDWHHLAQLDSGEKRSFEALDDSSERRVLRMAKRKDKEAAENAFTQIEDAEHNFQTAKQGISKQEKELLRWQSSLKQRSLDLQHTKENLPALWDVWKNFGWLSSKVKQIQQNLDDGEESIREAEQLLQEKELVLQNQRIAAEKLASIIPERWKEAKEAATVSKEQVEHAKRGLQDIARSNKDKFHVELHDLIDVEAEAAAQVDILTPNASIPVDVVLLDTPGFNTELPQHRRRAWEAIEEKADICILVSDIRQPMPETALKMLRRITPFCPFMHLALTKSDLALAEASILQEDPAQEILDAKLVAQQRVEPYWDGDMNIWVVSAEGEQRQKSQQIFTDFWASLPPQAHELKTKKLSIHAIGEFIDILDIHILIAQDGLRSFDTEAIRAVQQVFEQVESYAGQTSPHVISLIEALKEQIKIRWGGLEQRWTQEIQSCNTKSDVKLVLESIQQRMALETSTLTALLEKSLLSGCRQIGVNLIEEENSNFESLLQMSALPEFTQSSSSSSAWVAAGGLAGAATGLLLSGSLAGTLHLALGTGGITTLLLSPMAEGKEQAIQGISEGVLLAFTHICEQLNHFPNTLEQECSRQIQELLQTRMEDRRTRKRQGQVRQIQRMQDIQQRLEEAKFNFWPSTTS